MYEEFERQERRFLQRRLAVLTAVVASVFILLLLRLYFLQVVRGPEFRKRSEENRVSTVRVRAPRGNIYDRYGNVLVTNRPSFSVYLVPENVSDMEGTVAMLGDVLSMEDGEIRERLKRVRSWREFEPIRIKEDVSREEVAVIEAQLYAWTGVQIKVEPRRSYPFGRMAAHILGHVGQISQAELRRRQAEGYRIGDYIGKKGIERVLDGELKGDDGVVKLEVDSLGREIRELARREPVPGRDVTLTIDLGLQQVVDAALEGKSGAIVIIDPATGDILAAASSPAIDPNRFIRGLSREEWLAVESDGSHPLQNRILQAQYPPGSTFKIVTALAALEGGIVDERSTFYCSGSLKFGDRSYGCWKRGGHGEVNLHKALVQSCDVYFYQLGIKAGIDAVAEMGRRFGLGSASGLGLGGEASGIIPDRAWKKKARGEPWYPGETLSAAIGQGYNLVTPLQMAVLTATVANGGTLYRPGIVRGVSGGESATAERLAASMVRMLGVKDRNLKAVRNALEGVVHEERGTGRAAAVKGVRSAGKTGTAQVVRMKKGAEKTDEDQIPLRFRDHAWFVSYAPAVGRGEFAIAVVVEHGGHGGSASAPLAGEILASLRDMGRFGD